METSAATPTADHHAGLRNSERLIEKNTTATHDQGGKDSVVAQASACSRSATPSAIPRRIVGASASLWSISIASGIRRSASIECAPCERRRTGRTRTDAGDRCGAATAGKMVHQHPHEQPRRRERDEDHDVQGRVGVFRRPPDRRAENAGDQVGLGVGERLLVGMEDVGVEEFSGSATTACATQLTFHRQNMPSPLVPKRGSLVTPAGRVSRARTREARS